MGKNKRIGKSRTSTILSLDTSEEDRSEYGHGETPAFPVSPRRSGYSDEKDVKRDVSLWNTGDNVTFVPSRKPVKSLPCGLYEIGSNPNIGLYFNRVKFSTEHVIRFPDTNSEKVMKEIQTFWSKEAVFAKYGLSFKRGILLYGPPGSGKTCTIKLVIEDVIKRGGIVIKFDNPELFAEGIRVLRNIQPDTPVVVLMEDLDSILECFNESDVINILDGVDRVEKILFLATTNYPEKLGERVVNRPSRFDKRFLIDVPNAESRKLYLQSVIQEEEIKNLKIDIDKWVKDTDSLSIAHLKELVTSVVILGSEYGESLKILKDMRDKAEADAKKTGFGFNINTNDDED
mgnify:CR=1 FL=1